MKNDMKMREIINDIAKEEFEKTFEGLDKRIDAMGVELPDTLVKKIRQEGISIHQKNNISIHQKLASFFIFFLIISGLLCIINPDIVTAVKQSIHKFVYDESIESSDFQLQESIKTLYEPAIPDGFNISENKYNANLKQDTYISTDNKFIKISVYSNNYFLSHDKENYENYESISVQGFEGKQITKLDITTIIFSDNHNIFEVESNLSASEVLIIAKSIKD